MYEICIRFSFSPESTYKMTSFRLNENNIVSNTVEYVYMRPHIKYQNKCGVYFKSKI